MTGEDNSRDHLTHRPNRKKKQTLLALFISKDPLIVDQIHGLNHCPCQVRKRLRRHHYYLQYRHRCFHCQHQLQRQQLPW